MEDPAFHSRYIGDSGLMIISRFPILQIEFHRFSLGYFEEAEAKLGCLYA